MYKYFFLLLFLSTSSNILKAQEMKHVTACKSALGSLPGLYFYHGADLTRDIQKKLILVAKALRNNPNCHIAIVGHWPSGIDTQKRGVARVDAVISYMMKKQGISRERLIAVYGEPSADPMDLGRVDIRVQD
jgi:hypothetical protein